MQPGIVILVPLLATRGADAAFEQRPWGVGLTFDVFRSAKKQRRDVSSTGGYENNRFGQNRRGRYHAYNGLDGTLPCNG